MSRHSLARLVCALVLVAATAAGCKSSWSRPAKRTPVAQFGLFFGGQIQQRRDLPLEFDTTRQTQGFRITFPGPVSKPTLITWSLDFPTARTGPRGPSNAPRAERTETATLGLGAEQFEQLLPLRSNDVGGTYNIRVKVDDEVVLDRPFRMVGKQFDAQD